MVSLCVSAFLRSSPSRTEPNAFLKEHAQRLAGPVLSVAEGEGRNAVFLASLGLEVLGVDGSTVGLAKARRLAEAKGVSIDTLVVDLADYEPPAAAFGAVVSIFPAPGSRCTTPAGRRTGKRRGGNARRRGDR